MDFGFRDPGTLKESERRYCVVVIIGTRVGRLLRTLGTFLEENGKWGVDIVRVAVGGLCCEKLKVCEGEEVQG